MGVCILRTRGSAARGWWLHKKILLDASSISDSGKVGVESSVAYAYGDSTQSEVRKKGTILLGGLDLLYMSDEEQGAQNSVFGGTVSGDMT